MQPGLNPVRLGLVGLGRWGRILLANLTGLPGVELVALASGAADAAALAPPGCTVFAHWREMVAMPGLDGVVIATPPASHGEITLAALERRLAVLVEKPLTLDPQEARAIQDAARSAAVPVRVDHVHLYAPAFRKLMELAAGLGPITAIRGEAGNHGPYRADASVLWDWGPHDCAMAMALMGRAPDHASATLEERRPMEGGTGETVTLRLDFGGMVAQSRLSTLVDKCRRLEVNCAGGVLVYDDLAPVKLTLDGHAVEIGSERPLSIALNEFAQAIRLGDCSGRDLEIGLQVVQALSRAAEGLEP